MIVFQYVTEICHEIFEIPSTAKLNSTEIRKCLSLNREIKFREKIFPSGDFTILYTFVNPNIYNIHLILFRYNQ